MRILVVDDELVSRTKMKTIISRFGDVKTAENGAEAVNHFRKALENGCPYQLVTLDINMPDMTGTEVLYRFREMERQNPTNNGKAAIIIMVTAQSDKDNVMTCLQSGCNDYISKPFNYDIVRTKLLRFSLIARSSETPETPKKKKSAHPESLYADICAVSNKPSIGWVLPLPPKSCIQLTISVFIWSSTANIRILYTTYGNIHLPVPVQPISFPRPPNRKISRWILLPQACFMTSAPWL